MDNDGNDSSWMSTMTAVLCAAVAVGLYKEVPRIVDSVRQKLSAKEQPCECGKIECEKCYPGYERRMIQMPDSFVLVYAHGSPMLKADTPMGSGVLVSKTIAGKKRLMLVTARHVAQAVAAMRGGVEVGFMARPKGVERKPIRNRIWLIDGEKDDDLAVLDLTDEVEHSAIDLDGDERVKFATSDQFEGLGIKRGCKAFSVCGNVMAEDFTPKAGLYVGKHKTMSSHGDLCVFFLDAMPGNSGSPMFVMVNEDIYFVGIFSSGMTDNGKNFAGVVPLDNLMTLLGSKGAVYFSAEERERGVPDRVRTAKLMGDMRIPMGNHVIRHVSGTFPNSITCDGVEYSVERLEPQSVYFKISDKSGNEVARGSYSHHATECDARLEALDRADANRSLSVEETEKRMSFEWLDDEKTILLLTGTSWMHCLANKEVVIVYPRKYDDKRSLFLALSNAMVK